MKRFAIVGAGAVGSYYGGRLAEAGHDVRFLLRADFDTVRAKGLQVESCDGDFFLPKVQCAQTPADIGKVDIVIVAWKTTANSYYREVIEPMLHDDSQIITLQNGLGNVEALGELFGTERILGALCYVCINRIAPGVIRHTAGGKIELGGDAQNLHELATLFQNAKIPCQVAENLQTSQWRKLVWNIPFNGLCITEGGIDTEALLQKDGSETRVRALMNEVLISARALGHEIEEEFMDLQVKNTKFMGKYRPSSMIDYVEGRAVEIEAIWGEPLRQAQAAGVSVPHLAALYARIKECCSS